MQLRNTLLILVLTGALVYLVLSFGQEEGDAPQAGFSRQDLPMEQIPAGFMAEIPIEAGATITQNFEATLTDGRKQATRAFISGRGLEENYQIYLNFLTKNGWELKTNFESENLKTLLGAKNESELAVNISQNTNTGKVEVMLNVLTKQ